MENNKVDKGFELIYWKLGFRRKFIRTLWWAPIDIIALLLVWNLDSNISLKIVATIALILLTVTQLAYNYVKWKKDKSNAN